MFFHNLKYAFITMLKNKMGLIWCLLFPIALGTFMFLAFGNIYDAEMVFHKIPVVIVADKPNENLNLVLNNLAKGDDALLEIKDMSEEKALKALEDAKIEAIIYENDEISMKIKDSGYKTTIVKSILDEYNKKEAIVNATLQTNPGEVQKVLEILMGDKDYFTSKKTTDGNMNPLNYYFFAIFSMSCLFASFTSCEKTNSIQANAGPLGLRRSLTPSSKTSLVLAEFTAMVLVQFIAECLTLVYFLILGIEISKIPAILLILLIGSVIGVSLGIVVGSVFNCSDNMKQTICIVISMALAVLSDLCVNGIINMIEHSAPILNRINPAVLISNSFYALNVYDNYSKYFSNLATLTAMAVVLLTISILSLRRNKYASV